MPAPAAAPAVARPPIDDPPEAVDSPGFQHGIESLLQKLAQHDNIVLQDSGRPSLSPAVNVTSRPGKGRVESLIA
eukprot:7064256-Alexandrium_andersonii.AAC.1